MLAFGSSIHGSAPNDLDLLIVFDLNARANARKFADWLIELASLGLVHVTSLSVDENRAASFSDRVSAVHIAGDLLA